MSGGADVVAKAKVNGASPVNAVSAEFEKATPDGGWGSLGLTKRELFAAMAMQGLATVPCPGGVTHAAIEADTNAAVRYADALLAALESQP